MLSRILSAVGQWSLCWYPVLLSIAIMDLASSVVVWMTQTAQPLWSIAWHYEQLGLLAGAISLMLVWGRPSHPARAVRAVLFTGAAAWTVATLTNSIFLLLAGVPWEKLSQQLDFNGQALAAVSAALATAASVGFWLAYEERVHPDSSERQQRPSRLSVLLLLGITCIFLSVSSVPPAMISHLF